MINLCSYSKQYPVMFEIVQMSYYMKYVEFCRTEICTHVYLFISTLCKFSSEEIQVFIWGTKILSKRIYILFCNSNAYLPFTCVHTLTSNLVILMANKTWLNKYLFFLSTNFSFLHIYSCKWNGIYNLHINRLNITIKCNFTRRNLFFWLKLSWRTRANIEEYPKI